MSIHNPKWDASCAEVVFQLAGYQRDCRITSEALRDCFQTPGSEAPLQTVERHKVEIDKLAQRLIMEKQYEPDGRILIVSPGAQAERQGKAK